MIICPWCGTHYLIFQSNCKNCGGTIPAPRDEASPSPEPYELSTPPPAAPRPISNAYAWRLLAADGWGIGVLILGLLGCIFTLVGAALTAGIVTAFVGLPFLAIGIVFLGLAAAGLYWRLRRAYRSTNVLRVGAAARGHIAEVGEDYSVRVNGRHPWIIRYVFQVIGREFDGSVTTWNAPHGEMQPGRAAWVLYLPDDPQWNSIYPHP